MNIAFCMAGTAGRQMSNGASRVCDNHDYYAYSTPDELLRDMKTRNMRFDRIIYKVDFFEQDPARYLAEVSDYLKDNSPDTDNLLLYTQKDMGRFAGTIEGYRKHFAGPTGALKGLTEYKMTQGGIMTILNGNLSDFESCDDLGDEMVVEKKEPTRNKGRSQPAIVEPDVDDYDVYDDTDYDDMDESYESRPVRDMQEYSCQQQPTYNEASVGSRSDYDGAIQPSKSRYILFITTDSIPGHLVVTDMADSERTMNRHVAVVDLDVEQNRLTKCFDLNEYYGMNKQFGIDRVDSFIDRGTGVELISNGVGVDIRPDSLERLIGSSMMRSFDTVILYCPLRSMNLLTPTVIRQCDIRIVLRGTFDEMLTAYGYVTDRRIVTGAIEDQLFDKAQIYILVHNSKETQITIGDFNADVDMLKQDVNWVRNLWIDPNKTVIL